MHSTESTESTESTASTASARGYFAGRSLRDLAADLRSRRTTATELVRHSLTAIARLNPSLNAFVSVAADAAQTAADRADRERADGVDRGPLQGIPVAVKDIIAVAGQPTTMGSRHFTGHVPATDAACVRLMREAGAIVIGMTTTHEFAYGPTGDRSAHGPSRNPYDPARMTGGSSGGSAAAVAAGMVPLAVGTDTGGSVRIPAALCGTAGFKPAYGMLPTDGVFPLSTSFDHVGVLANCGQDCRIAYQALLPGGRAPDPDGVRPVDRPVRVAWLHTTAFSPHDPRVLRTTRAALERHTGSLEELSMPSDRVGDLREVYVAVQSSETAAVHADRLARAPELFDPETLQRLQRAATVPGWRYVRALRTRTRLTEVIDELFARHDVLALPTVPLTAPFVDERDTELDGTPVAVPMALLALTSPWNVLGLPALSVPVGRVDGLPVGLQLVSRTGHEESLFEVAALISAAVA